MTRFGLDYTGLLTPAAHKAVGSTFACRYLRDLGAGEVKMLHAGGIDLILIDEHAAAEALGGFAAGVARAKSTLAAANALGAPASTAIFGTADFDETPAQASVVADFFRGRNSVIPLARSGAYGGYWTLKRLFDAKLITYGWQTYGWSGSNLDKRCQLFQYSNGHVVAGVGCDYNRALAANFGQWAFAVPPAPKPPAPKPPTPAWDRVQITTIAGFEASTGAWRHESTQVKPLPLGH